jgi:hypothetical protein
MHIDVALHCGGTSRVRKVFRVNMHCDKGIPALIHHRLAAFVCTRGSPRSCRFFSFSCRLLKLSVSTGASDAAEGLRPRKYGEMTDPHSLKTAYRGICDVLVNANG